MDIQVVQSKIYEIRGYKVILDRDLAEMYGVETKVLKQSVKRDIERFPSDFMFELNTKEWQILRSQIVTSRWGGTRYMPLLDCDMAGMYEVETRRLIEQVKRNLKRYPNDFMFQLTEQEFQDWKSQFAISNSIKNNA